MKKLASTIAFAIALPGLAYAQEAPASPAKQDCCRKGVKKCCCGDMAKEGRDQQGMKDRGRMSAAQRIIRSIV